MQPILLPQDQTVLYRMLLPMLFYAPLSHLHDCNDVYTVVVLMDQLEWRKYVDKLIPEWQEFVLYVCALSSTRIPWELTAGGRQLSCLPQI